MSEMSWLDVLPSDLVTHIYDLVQTRVKAELLGELVRVRHTFDDDGHTIDFSGLANGVKYVRLMNTDDGTSMDVESTTVHYLRSDCDYGDLGAVVVVTSTGGEHYRVL